ncbi:hypothetical protein P343_13805 [Sporolactobacillus laevolacticus DSM 442]|uniref:Uncharacterized protein n=1 Tax=Sporolactobacillus laevolacticus DSM 442 TaxID=1395513 RepID=V6IVE1_9BACL|nr:hypothetical protein P343_13805 [Sporolactobacillus laevolacticus DSM 442]
MTFICGVCLDRDPQERSTGVSHSGGIMIKKQRYI